MHMIHDSFAAMFYLYSMIYSGQFYSDNDNLWYHGNKALITANTHSLEIQDENNRCAVSVRVYFANFST